MSPKNSWRKCDELNRPIYLEEGDDCYYYEEYFQGDYTASNGNDLVSNFKKDIKYKNTSSWHYKNKAIDFFSQLLINSKFPIGSALIPAPTSKPRMSPLFDSRLDDVVRNVVKRKPDIFAYELLEAIHAQTPNHLDGSISRDPSEVIKNIKINKIVIDSSITCFYIIDDLITTGGHFVASKRILKAEYPLIQVKGIFLAKRIFSDPDWYDPKI